MSVAWAEWFHSLFGRRAEWGVRHPEWLRGRGPGPESSESARLAWHAAPDSAYSALGTPHSALEWSGLVPLEPRLLLSVSFADPVTYNTGNYSYALIAADLNGDGSLDLVTADGFGNNVSVLTNDGSGGFTNSGNVSVGAAPYAFCAADFDGDGNLDLAVGNRSSESVSVLRGTGSAAFAPAEEYDAGGFQWALAAADFDGDGYIDLAVGMDSGPQVTLLRNDGDGTFSLQGTLGATDMGVRALVAADLNGDGHADLAVVNNADSTVSVLLNDGTGGFGAPAALDVGDDAVAIAAADLDGDGYLDLAVANGGSNSVSVLLNDGSGGFGPAADFAIGTGTGPRGVAAADFDGDGCVDLVMANSSDNSVSVLLNTGSGSFAAPLRFAVGWFPAAVAAADLSGDGHADIVTANSDINNISVLRNLTFEPDATPPTPDPSTWAQAPHGTGADSIRMAATTATDPSGVEYYFACVEGGGHDSGWLNTPDYEDTGLSVGVTYTYTVQTRDKSASQNTGTTSAALSATTEDTTPPTPDPSTWATAPHATGETSIRMVATTATDPSGVEYYFACTAGGGHDSGWRDSPDYQDTGLTLGIDYTYTVQTRDKSANQNIGTVSTALSAATADTTAPTPSPSTWATVPYATGATSIRMVATTATDSSGVEYYFDCTAGGGHDSGWRDSPDYEDTGLTSRNTYTYTVQTRDKSASHNTGTVSAAKSAITGWLAPVVVTPLADMSAKENQTGLTVSLAGKFDDPNIVGMLVRIDTNVDAVLDGIIYIELFNVASGSRTAAPITTANFLHYVNGDTVGSTKYGSYVNTIFHRSSPGYVDPVTHLDIFGNPGFVVQGGGFAYPSFTAIATGPTILNEYNASRSNVRGTVAMAKVGTNPNSATDQFFFNLSDNSANLDSQNGGFTVFARVVGRGMDVVDAMAALPVYNGTGLNAAFDSLPLQNTPPAQAGPNNVVMIQSILAVGEFTYSVTTDTPLLLNPTISGGTLAVNFMPNQAGTGHVTVRATDVNGHYVESTFEVTVAAPGIMPTIASLTVNPTALKRGAQDLVLSANSTLDGPGGQGVAKVEFFRDANASGAFEPGTDIKIGEDTSSDGGWNFRASTQGWPVGSIKVFARAQNVSGFGSSPVSAAVTVNNTAPTMINPQPLATLPMDRTAWLSYDLLKSYTNTYDPNTGDVIKFKVLQVLSGTLTLNGEAVTPGTTLIGSGDTVAWTPDWYATGTLSAFKIAATDGDASSRSLTVRIVTKTVIRSVTISPKPVSMPGGSVHFDAQVNDEDFPIARIEYWYDSNDNGSLDTDTDLKLGQDINVLGGWNLTTTNTSTFKTGTATFFARAVNTYGNDIAIYGLTTTVNIPPVIDSASGTPATVTRGATTTLTAFNPHDPTLGGEVAGVKFYRDVDKDGKLDATDVLVGSGTLIPGTNRYALTVSTAAWAAGENKILAVATDNSQGYGLATATVTVNNILPLVTSLKVGTDPVSQPGGALKLIAAAKDADGKVAKVSFYYDTNGSGVFDTGDVKIGEVTTGASGAFTLVTTNTGAFLTGDARFFAVATDNDGGASGAATATGHVNIPPVIDGFTVTPDTVTRGNSLTLTATNPHDPTVGGEVTGVDFFLDANSNGAVDPTDIRLGAGTLMPGTNNYTLTVSTSGLPAGADQFIARALDNNGGAGLALATAHVSNIPPTVDSLAASAATLARLGTLTLTANHAVDPDGRILKVVFYIDSDASGTFDPLLDAKIGEAIGKSALTYKIPAAARLGPTLFFAQALDNDSRASNTVSTAVTVTNVLPKVGTFKVTPSPVNQPANITLAASNVVNLDGSGLVKSVKFYEDVNKNGVVDGADRLLGEDLAATSGVFSVTIPSSQVAYAGSVRFLAVAIDDDDAASVAKAASGTVNPPVGIDLIATAAAYSPKVFNLHSQGQTLDVTGTVRNQASKASGPFLVEVLLKNKDTSAEYSVGLIDVTSLAALASRTVSTTIDFSGLATKPPAGSYYFILRADATNAIGEINELNNDWISATPDVTIVA